MKNYHPFTDEANYVDDVYAEWNLKHTTNSL